MNASPTPEQNAEEPYPGFFGSSHTRDQRLEDPNGMNAEDFSDQRSQPAIAELSALMLNLGINDTGEPSFTIPLSAFESLDGFSTTQTTVQDHISQAASSSTVFIEQHDTSSERQLIKLFFAKFNPYHQFFD
jgi:hypothetical protein